MLSLVNQVFIDLGTLLHVSGFSEMITHIPGGDRTCEVMHAIQVLSAMLGMQEWGQSAERPKVGVVVSKEVTRAGP